MARFSLLLCLIAGLLSACAFAPLDLWPLGLAGVGFLLWQVDAAPRLRSALARGWWFGFGHFVLSLNWIATAFTYQANMPAWLGWVGVVVLSLYLAIFPAAAAGLAWRSGRMDRTRFVLLFAAAWVVTEYLRGVLLSGFPWNPLGIIALHTPAAMFAALAGTYALGGLVILAAGILFLLARRAWSGAAGLAIATGLLIIIALVSTPVADGGPGVLVRVVQPNVPQEVKHSEGYGRQMRAFQQAARHRGPPRLLLWPEDGVPYFLDEDPLATLGIARWLRPGDMVLTGGAKLERDETGWAVGARNSIWLIDDDARLRARYDKAHLVPFGEYLPLREVLTPLGLDRVVPGDIDFWVGPGPRTMSIPGFGRVGSQICYEIVFSGHVVDPENRPDFIFNPSNDAWFGTWGPPQHFAQARLRALEEGIPVVRATPTGISGIIDARGNIVAALPMHEPGVIDAAMPPAAPPTLFARIGNWGAFGFAALLLIAVIALSRLRPTANGASEQRT